MSWLSNLFHGKLPTEADVINFVNKTHTDADVAYDWIVANGPGIVQDIRIVMGVVQALGIGNPYVAEAVIAVNVAATALNAMVAAKAANEDVFHAIVDTYNVIKQLQLKSAQAVLAAV